ncbi:MAG TPA: alpha-ketoglutarate-dependent dioxygenase AlkB [Candidatus Baltobacteraceae bacterium]|nr:alpha-ketoglutarate-dependent dioxygenase AlkB [Candidatus Baltobacteraceae bacterium]
MSQQLALFETDSRVVLDDASGSILYYRNVLTPAHTQRVFERLLAGVPWRSERRMMYEREVDVPRLVASSSVDEALLPPLAEVLPIVERRTRSRYTHIGMNLYRDGRDSVAPHNDKLHELIVGQPIALLSLGATRKMTIRSKGLPRRILDLDLEPGSVLVMSYLTQYGYDHGIPKTSESVGPRISLAFRVRPR